MLALCLSVFVAGIVGSAHCAGMCGPFVMLATHKRQASDTGLLAVAGAYNLGRLVTYLVVGALAGTAGLALDLGASWMVSAQHGAAAVAGTVMIVAGLVGVARHFGMSLPRAAGASRVAQRLVGAIGMTTQAASRLGPSKRAAVIGMVTTLMPCGWLYVFALTAAGTADPLLGAAVMASFWLGTVPVMTVLGATIRRLSPRLRMHVPLVMSVMVMVVGVFALVSRDGITPPRGDEAADAPPCHDSESPLP